MERKFYVAALTIHFLPSPIAFSTVYNFIDQLSMFLFRS